MILTTDPRLKTIRDKVESGTRLSLDDGLLMYDPDIPVNDVGQLANLVRTDQWKRWILQHQHASKSYKRLRVSL